MNESEIKVMKTMQNDVISQCLSVSRDVRKLENRLISLERALEALLKKEEMSKLNLSGGDGEWY